MCATLGLVAREDPPRIANPIYSEAIAQERAYQVQAGLWMKPSACVGPNSRLDTARLLAEFQAFSCQNSEHWLKRFQFHEAGPPLLQAFLQKAAEQRRANRARVRLRSRPHGPARRLANGRGDLALRRVQAPAQGA